jgi:hypothetical protein
MRTVTSDPLATTHELLTDLHTRLGVVALRMAVLGEQLPALDSPTVRTELRVLRTEAETATQELAAALAAIEDNRPIRAQRPPCW